MLIHTTAVSHGLQRFRHPANDETRHIVKPAIVRRLLTVQLLAVTPVIVRIARVRVLLHRHRPLPHCTLQHDPKRSLGLDQRASMKPPHRSSGQEFLWRWRARHHMLREPIRPRGAPKGNAHAHFLGSRTLSIRIRPQKCFTPSSPCCSRRAITCACTFCATWKRISVSLWTM